MSTYSNKKTAGDSNLLTTTAKVRMSNTLLKALFDLAASETLEWTVMGHMVPQKDGSILIDDFIFPYQENSSGATEIPNTATDENKKDFDPTYEWRVRGIEGIDENPLLMRASDWNVAIHSHNKMQVFWSGTDITELIDTMKERQDNFVAIVVNAKAEYKCIVGIPDLKIFAEAEILPITEPTISEFVKLKKKDQTELLKTIDKNEKLAASMTANLAKYTLEPATPVQSNWDGFGFTYGKDKIKSGQLYQNSNDMALLVEPDFFYKMTAKDIGKFAVKESGYYECDPKTLFPKDLVEYPYTLLEKIRKGKCVVGFFTTACGLESIYWPTSESNKIPLFFKNIIDAQDIADPTT